LEGKVPKTIQIEEKNKTKIALVTAVAGLFALLSDHALAECGSDDYGRCVANCEYQREGDGGWYCDIIRSLAMQDCTYWYPQDSSCRREANDEYSSCMQGPNASYDRCQQDCWYNHCEVS
jgi:hypothetical protein